MLVVNFIEEIKQQNTFHRGLSKSIVHHSNRGFYHKGNRHRYWQKQRLGRKISEKGGMAIGNWIRGIFERIASGLAFDSPIK